MQSIKVIQTEPGIAARNSKFLYRDDEGNVTDITNSVKSCDISMRVDAVTTATLKLHATPETIAANPMLHYSTLTAAAAILNLKLVPQDHYDWLVNNQKSRETE